MFYLGSLISLVPIALCGIIILLVVQSIMLRKRRDLLLYLIMGAQKSSLLIQSILIASFILVPSMILGFILGTAPMFYASEIVLTPDTELVFLKFLEAMQTTSLPLDSLFMLFFFTNLIGYVVCYWVVSSICSSDPTYFFRGGE